ncbi:MAG: hypothetical protein HXS48_16425 [Theionarchaea archaeon]|nr:MAG: hypothetical protein AYK19_18615 [Theionarchaea archaeon DG-70-1]MBU7028521.1 hypothetical protein [Theionarchaea archaeon]
MTDYVIDTCILVEANNKDIKRAFQFIELLIIISNEHTICLDRKRGILKEYEENQMYEGFSGIWFKNMQRAAKIVYVKKKIGKKQKEKLVNLKFDIDDIKFVATANACGKRIISDDTDYNKKVTAYLREKMGIIIFRSGSELM